MSALRAADIPDDMTPKSGQIWRADGNLWPAFYLKIIDESWLEVLNDTYPQKCRWWISGRNLEILQPERTYSSEVWLRFKYGSGQWTAERIGLFDPARTRSYAKGWKPSAKIILKKATGEFLPGDTISGEIPGFGLIVARRSVGPIRAWESLAPEPRGKILEKDSARVSVLGGSAMTTYSNNHGVITMLPFSKDPSRNYNSRVPYQKDEERGIFLKEMGDYWQLLPQGLFSAHGQLAKDTKLRITYDLTAYPTTEGWEKMQKDMYTGTRNEDPRVPTYLDFLIRLEIGDNASFHHYLANPQVSIETLSWVAERIITRRDYADEARDACGTLNLILGHANVSAGLVTRIAAGLEEMKAAHRISRIDARCLLSLMLSPYAPPDAESNFRQYVDDLLKDPMAEPGVLLREPRPIPMDLLIRMAQSKGFYMRRELAERRQDMPEIFYKLAQDPELRVRAAVAGNAYIPHELQLKFARMGEGEEVSSMVFKGGELNPGLSPEAAEVILSRYLRIHMDGESLILNSDLLPEERSRYWVEQYSESSDSDWRATAGRCRRAPATVLAKLAQDAERKVRFAVAYNSRSPRELLEQMRDSDLDPEVQRAADLTLSRVHHTPTKY